MPENAFCPHCGRSGPEYTALADAVLRVIAEDRSLRPVLQKMADGARELVDARYAAIGVPDGEGGFTQFVTSGMSEPLMEAIGPLPRVHGLLAAMLKDPEPYRTANIQEDPRFQGWPPHHPGMRSFVGVPIVSKGSIIGAFYLTDKIDGGGGFTQTDEYLIRSLAAHAAIAIENAGLHERSRELTVIEERNRLARELHDAVSQRLFSLVLTAEAAATLADRDAQESKTQIRKVQELAREAVGEMHSLIFELRPAELEREGFVATLRKHVDVLRRVYQAEVSVQVDGERRLALRTEKELFRIAQEALNNALKHARAEKVWVEVGMRDSRVSLAVCDDGVGFDPQAPPVRSRHLGLTSMEERAQALGGELRIDSTPGKGTKVCLEVEVAR